MTGKIIVNQIEATVLTRSSYAKYVIAVAVDHHGDILGKSYAVQTIAPTEGSDDVAPIEGSHSFAPIEEDKATSSSGSSAHNVPTDATSEDSTGDGCSHMS